MYLTNIRQALEFVWHSSKKWTILLIVTQLMQALLPLVALYLIKLIVDSLTEVGADADFRPAIQYVLMFGGIHLLMAVIDNFQQLISETQQQLVSDYMATVIIDQAVNMDISYYENSEYHDTLHIVQRQALNRPVMILKNLSNLLRSGFLLASLAGLLIYLHWGIAVILLVFALPIAGVKWYYSRKIYEWVLLRRSLERRATYFKRVLTNNNFSKEIRIFNLGTYLKEKFIQVRKSLFKEKYRIGKQRTKAGIFAKTAEIIAMTLTYAFIAWRTFNGNITIGDLVMYFQAFQRGQAAIQSSLDALVGLYDNRLFLSQLFELLNLESLLKEPEEPKEIPETVEKEIGLKNVSFIYPGTERVVLKDINLSFPKGQVIALVGENGSGKTTLVKLLCRLYDPTQGAVFFDKENIKNYTLADLRKNISVIYQDFSKYAFSVKENIRIADGDNPSIDEKIKTAAEKSGAAAFIQNFPDNYEQQLGRQFENGAELSGGQWQKMALARAFYKDAEVIILDEPSSAIDPLAEAEIFEEFRKLAKDKILILVTHRLYNLKMADKIVVMNEGEIEEEGSHDELFENKGLYFEMFKKQMEK